MGSIHGTKRIKIMTNEEAQRVCIRQFMERDVSWEELKPKENETSEEILPLSGVSPNQRMMTGLKESGWQFEEET